MKETVQFKSFDSDNIIASEVGSIFHKWNSYRDEQLSLWQEIDNYVHATDNTPFNSNFDHNTFIPVISEIHEDLQAILYSTIFPHNDWLGWQPFDREAATVEKRKNVLGYIKHIHQLNEFKCVVRKLIDDYTRYGNCFAQVVHVNEQKVLEDGTVDTGYVGPKVKRISPLDIVFNPTAPSFQDTAKIYQEHRSLGGFLEWAKSLEANGTVVNMEAVENVLSTRRGNANSDTSTTRKNAQYLQSGFNSIESYMTDGFVELLWFYGDVYSEVDRKVHKNRRIVVLDRTWVLINDEEPEPYTFKGTWKARPDNLWGQGALDNIVGMNFMINHRENAKNDSIDHFAYPDRLYAGEIDEIYDENTRQFKYISPEANGVVQDITPDASVLTFNTEIEMHEQRCRRAARLPQQLAGFRTPGEKTATEVQSLNDGAFRGFINKAEQLEQDVIEKLVQAEIIKARDNYSSVITVASEDEDKLFEFLEVTEEDLKSNGKLVPYGSRRFARLIQQQAGLTQLSSTNLMQMIQPHTNTWNLAEAVAHVYGFEDLSIFEKNAAILEQVESQQVANRAQQELIASTEQRTPDELTPEDLSGIQDTETSQFGV